MKVLILGGVGAVGIEASRDFIKYGEYSEVIIADYRYDKIREFIREVRDSRVSGVKFNADDIDQLKSLIKDSDLVINALPFRYDYIVTKYAVELGVSGVDVAVEEEQLQLSEEASKKSIVFVPGIGATPGTTNLMAKKAVELLEDIESIEIYWAAFRSTAPSPGLLHVTIWEFDPKLEERVIYEDGVFKKVPPFSGAKEIEFHDPIGKQTTYFVPHSETWTLPKYLSKKPKRVYVRGTWPEETMNLLKTLFYFNFYANEPIEINGSIIKPMEFIYKFLLSRPEARRTKIWGYGLRVEAVGYKNGRKARVIITNRHPHYSKWGGSRAYFKCIGIPLSIGAQFIIEGKFKEYGVWPPEAAFEPDDFFSELSKRGIEIRWHIEYI